MDSVVDIIVFDPNDMNNTEIIYELSTTKGVLCKIPKFQEWFHNVEFYGEYLDIGDNEFNGLSNMTLVNKSKKQNYVLSINCYRHLHPLGVRSPPIIQDVVNILSCKNKKIIESRKNYIISAGIQLDYQFI